ncbi:MAG TPA: PBP1A family penicillin-binding protein [Methylomirabilota bacterium]|nr:PBP1A family penicillin-binding protein [Methylomirabilota bacterium]
MGAVVLITLGLGVAMALAGTALVTYTALELARFQRVETRRTTIVLAAGQTLAPGMNVHTLDLAQTLDRLGYREVPSTPASPGQFHRGPDLWDIYLHGVAEDGPPRPAPLRLELAEERITRLLHAGEPVPSAALEPEVLTSVADRPGEEYRPVQLAEAPPTLVQAVLAAEDHRFFEHAGLDLHGLARAFWVNLRTGRVAQGGSTITQQLVKNRLLGAQRTFGRKLREAWLAAVIEWHYDKERILESYLNEIYLGQRGGLAIRGVGAASESYFGKQVHQLTLAEAALLAGMVRAPNSYSPVLHPERSRQRRDAVLARLRELQRISLADYEAARREPLRAPPAPIPGQLAPYFGDYVREELEDRLEGGLGGVGNRVFTTLDPMLQRFAEQAIRRGLERLESMHARLKRAEPTQRLQAALIALDPSTGHVRALVGGRDYQTSQFNRAAFARRQPGSAFKPFVYAAALGRFQGQPAFTPATFVEDEPLEVAVDREIWSPRNYADRYEGRVTVRRALEQSLNAATVRIALETGLDHVIHAARELGVTSRLAPVPAMALGAFEVSPLELARAYLPLANGGVRVNRATAVRAVRAADGNPGSLDQPGTAQVITPAEAYLMTTLLEGVIASGTGAPARPLQALGNLAGKTGTTNDARDAWFVGYTPNLLALVWVGFDGGEPHGLSGSEAALPVWTEFMRQALDAYPPPALATPAGITLVGIDASNGRVANLFCPVVVRETFLTGTEPSPCDQHGALPEPVVEWWRRFRNWIGR